MKKCHEVKNFKEGEQRPNNKIKVTDSFYENLKKFVSIKGINLK